jgi:hypothetical protein
MNKRIALIITLFVAAFFTMGLTYTGWLSKDEMLQANGDDAVGVIYDPNSADTGPTFKWTSRNALLSNWTGSAQVTTLGTIGTGTWNASFTDAALTAIDAATWTGAASITTLGDVTTGSINKIAADESADAALTVLGQVHIRGDEDRYSMHFGAGGEIAGEATMSGLHKISCSFDPGSWYDSSPYVNLGPILAKQYPNGIIIDYWEVTCHLDPDVEMTMNLCYSVNSFDLADPNVIDVMDTTNGLSSEDTDASINGGAAVPAGVYLYLMFGADPEGTCVLLTPTILYHGEED